MNVETDARGIRGYILHGNDPLIPDKNNSKYVWDASRIPCMDRIHTPNDDQHSNLVSRSQKIYVYEDCCIKYL